LFITRAKLSFYLFIIIFLFTLYHAQGLWFSQVTELVCASGLGDWVRWRLVIEGGAWWLKKGLVVEGVASGFSA